MPELGPYGSVRGARGNSRPYRESRRGHGQTDANDPERTCFKKIGTGTPSRAKGTPPCDAAHSSSCLAVLNGGPLLFGLR